ncbi:MAG: hypothetical protein H6922_06490 [Pseudomonadaceae bacterium]|nr:hypothetical protein [Pseudomonadaceae bacterium]
MEYLIVHHIDKGPVGYTERGSNVVYLVHTSTAMRTLPAAYRSAPSSARRACIRMAYERWIEERISWEEYDKSKEAAK